MYNNVSPSPPRPSHSPPGASLSPSRQTLRSFESYRDDDAPARPSSHPDLQDYWDPNQPLPAPHHLSGTGGSYPPSTRSSSEHLPLQERLSPPLLYRDASQPRLSPFSDPSNPNSRPTSAHGPFADPSSNLSLNDMSYPSLPANRYDRYAEVREQRSEQRSEWLEKQQRGSKRTRVWLVVGAVVVVALVVAGIVAGVVIARRNASSSSSSSPNSGSGSSGGGSSGTGALAGSAGVVQLTDPNDASTFIKDDRLSNSFYGFAYTPLNVQLPWCGAVQGNVTEDIILLSQLTTRIRLYGADCNQSALVLEAIEQSKVNMDVYLAIYVTDNTTSYTEQRDKVSAAIQTYGTTHVAGVAVGNEFILNNLTDLGLSDPNSTAGVAAADYLISLMQDTRSVLNSVVPVGTADAGSMLTPHLLAGADFGMANVHPWFGNVAIDDAADWTNNFFQDFDVSPSLATPNKPPMFIAETGWPTKSSNAQDATDGPSAASVANLQTFMDTFVCQANQNATNYFFFEYFDEPWKDVQFGGVEGWWGLFTSDKQLKNVTIPSCSHS